MEGSSNGVVANGASMLLKKQSTPMREPGTSSKDPVIHARGEESADEMMAQKSLTSSMGMEKKSSSEPAKSANKEKESDAWDIPAFLRRRKR
jgi:hypothetical protein